MSKVTHHYCNDGRYTVVSTLIFDEDNFEYPIGFEFAVAFCSPKDRFNKRIGREIAYRRLLEKDTQYYRYFPITSNMGKLLSFRRPKYYDFKNLVDASIFATMKIPRWMNDQ